MKEIRDLLESHLFTLAGTPVNVATLLAAALVGLLSWWMSWLVERSTARFLGRRGVEAKGSIEATARLLRYLVLAVGLAVAVHTLGLKLTSLFTAGAVLAVGVGFAMQNIMQNFVSGIILLTERSITPDDVLEVDGVMVKVKKMGMRATVAQNRDYEDLIIPNSLLVGSTVKNFTLKEASIRIQTVVGVAYGSDMKQVQRVLEETVKALPWCDQVIEPRVQMTEFGSSSVNFTVRVGIPDPWQRQPMESMLNEAVWFALKDAGVTIAFPQLDVHMHPADTERPPALAKAPG
jgi:potassium-dependent mechanosensitive channel